jgi:hypothetical protein
MSIRARRMVVFDREFTYFGDIKEESLIRLLRKINFDGPRGCWLWTGYCHPSGYGGATVGGKGVLVHRFLWSVLTGNPTPRSIDLHHKTEEPTLCVGPQCCNPQHLEPLSRAAHYVVSPTNITHSEWTGSRCSAGHDITNPESVYVNPKTGKRKCKACNNEWQKSRGQRARSAISAERSAQLRSALESRWREAQGLYVKDGVRCCPNGHPRTEENAYRYLNRGRPAIACRLCRQALNKARIERLKAAHANDPKPEPRKRGPKPRTMTASSIPSI